MGEHDVVDAGGNVRTWDVRVVRYVDDVTAQLLVRELLDPNPARGTGPTVTRIGRIESYPWLGTLRVTQIPVCVSAAKLSAVGHIELLPVGAGTSEVRVCLVGRARLDRARGYRRLQRLAEQVGDRLAPARTIAAPPVPAIPRQRAAAAAETLPKTPRA